MRGETFVSRKITRGLARIVIGLDDCLYLGNLEARRDWGHARDFVEMQWLMLQQPEPDDYVIATGHTNKLRDFIQAVFNTVGLHWEDHVRTDTSFFRPTDIAEGYADPGKARKILGWEAHHKMEGVAQLMVEQQLKMLVVKKPQSVL